MFFFHNMIEELKTSLELTTHRSYDTLQYPLTADVLASFNAQRSKHGSASIQIKEEKNCNAIRVSENIGGIVFLRCDLYKPASLPIGFDRIFLG